MKNKNISQFFIKNGFLRKNKINFKINKNIRPTKDNIKQLIYTNIFKYKNVYALELFAGTGIISFNIFSNYYKKNILIEKNILTYQNLIINKKKLIKSNNFKIYNKNALTWIKYFNILNISHIILDPPYNLINIAIYFKKINKINFLKKYIYIIFENKKKMILKNTSLNYFILKKNSLGKTFIYIIKKLL